MNEEIPTPVNDPTGSPTGPGSPPVNAEVPEDGDDEDGEDSEARG